MSPDIQESLLSTIQRDCQVLRDFGLSGYSLQLGLVLRVSQIVMYMYIQLYMYIRVIHVYTCNTCIYMYYMYMCIHVLHVAFVSILTFEYWSSNFYTSCNNKFCYNYLQSFWQPHQLNWNFYVSPLTLNSISCMCTLLPN